MADVSSILEALYGVKPATKKVAPPAEQSWSDRVIAPLGRQYGNLPPGINVEHPEDTTQDFILTPGQLKHNRDNLNTPGLSDDNNIGYRLPETHAQAFESPAHYNIMAQARALHPGLANPIAGPDLNKGGTKEFLLRALQLGPMAIGAKGPSPVAITGGKNFALLNEMSPTVIHNPNSAMDLSLKAPLKTDLGVKQVSGAGIAENINRPYIPDMEQPGYIPQDKGGFVRDAKNPTTTYDEKGFSLPKFGDLKPAENANRYNPKVMDILDNLAKKEIPVREINDSKGGTTYIKAKNPLNNDPIQIRVPDPIDDHPIRGDTLSKFTNRHGVGNYFDVSNAKTSGALSRVVKQNQSGENYGSDLKALYDAIDHVTGRGLVPEGRAPNYSKPQQPIKPEPTKPDPNQLKLDLQQPNSNEAAMSEVKPNLYGQPLEHTQIDQILANMRQDPKFKDMWEHVDRNSQPPASKAATELYKQIFQKTLDRVSMEKPQLTIKEMMDMSRKAKDVRRTYEFTQE